MTQGTVLGRILHLNETMDKLRQPAKGRKYVVNEEEFDLIKDVITSQNLLYGFEIIKAF